MERVWRKWRKCDGTLSLKLRPGQSWRVDKGPLSHVRDLNAVLRSRLWRASRTEGQLNVLIRSPKSGHSLDGGLEGMGVRDGWGWAVMVPGGLWRAGAETPQPGRGRGSRVENRMSSEDSPALFVCDFFNFTFLAARGLSLVAGSRGWSLVAEHGFPLPGPDAEQRLYVPGLQ